LRIAWTILFAVSLSGLFGQPALAGKRVALVVGNSGYQNVVHLANPVNDAATLADVFKKANFDVVTLRTDLGALELRRALREFGDRARDADIAVIYYAGHGLEVDGINYLIPVDAVLERDSDVYDEAIPLDRLLVAVEPAGQLRLVILDACRDNPFARKMKRMIAQRAVGQGLAKVEPDRPNTLIAFAARAGSTASDGDGKNSPFATALAAHLATPGLDLRKAFGYVRDDVLKATNNRQEPFIYGSLGGDDMMLVPAPKVAAPPPPPSDPNEPLRRDYELAERVGTKEAWDFFLATYPKGFYSKLAELQRDKLAAEEKARATAEEQARLAAEGAKAAEQAKAAAEAKVADDARLAAEKKKLQEEAKVAEAERANAVAQAKAAEDAKLAAEQTIKAEEEKAARERAAAEKAASLAKAVEDARIAAEKATEERIAKAQAEADAAAAKAKAAEEARAAQEARAAGLQKAIEAEKAAEAEQRAKAIADARIDAKTEAKTQDGKFQEDNSIAVATLSPADKSGEIKPADDIPRLLQSELRRVGCLTGSIDGSWNAAAQRSLALFNKSAGTTLDTEAASLDTLDVVRGRSGRVCPLTCDHGYKADGDACIKIDCKAGYELDDSDNCVKVLSRKPEKPAEARRNPDEGAQPAGREASLPSGREDSRPNTRAAQPGLGGELTRCGATSCSGALRGCIRKSSITGGDPSHCTERYHGCLQTGEFNGRFCQHSGLARN
jgi:uncharacterized caspase-like protein